MIVEHAGGIARVVHVGDGRNYVAVWSDVQDYTRGIDEEHRTLCKTTARTREELQDLIDAVQAGEIS